MQIVTVWNTDARLRLNNHKLTRIRDLARDIPEANWRYISNDPILNACHPRIETGFQEV